MSGFSDASTPNSRPAKGEWAALLILLAVLSILNICTYAVYPSVWNDDILWADPAINLVRTGHFTTSVWQLQPANAFWAAQSPIYPFALSVWLRIAGFSLLAIRCFNFLLICIAALLVWIGSWKYQLVKRPPIRLLMVALVMLGYGISFAYRSCRPDVCGLISLLSLGLAFSIKETRRRNVLIFVCALIAPWVGVQIGLYACCAVFMAMLIFRNVLWRDVFLVGTAVGLGACGMLAFYALNGVLHDFIASLHQAANEHMTWGNKPSYLASVPRRVSFSVASYLIDFSIPPLIAGVVLAYFSNRRFRSNRPAMRFLLALFFLIPWIFSFVAHFAFYYSYMIYVPLVVAFCMAYSEAQEAGGGTLLRNLLLPGCAAVAIAVGLPLRLMLCGAFYQLTPRTAIKETIQARVQPQDIVFCDYTAYFEAKQCVQNVFIPAYATNFVVISRQGHGFTPEEKKSITVLIVKPEKMAELQPFFGGEWKPVSEPFGDSMSLDNVEKIPIVGSRVAHHFGTPQMQRSKIEIFRREPGS